MAGTVQGGIKAAATNKARYGENFYKKIGESGGTLSRGGGFAVNHEMAVEAGRKGGKASRRTREDISAGTWSCPEGCAEKFTDKPAVSKHVYEQHRGSDYECFDCGKEFRSARGLRLHRDIMTETIKQEIIDEPIMEETQTPVGAVPKRRSWLSLFRKK